jgi:putative oxidoreductase
LGNSLFTVEVSASPAQKASGTNAWAEAGREPRLLDLFSLDRCRNTTWPAADQEDSMTDTAGLPAAASRTVAASILAKVVAVLAVIPYALVALGLRFVMARLFFLSGQAWIEGPRVPIRLGIRDLEYSVILPAEIKATTFQLFETQYANLPIAPTVAAYLFAYAAFVLPICLVVGFATRLTALGLLAMTMLLQVYVTPAMWWPEHVYWVSILLVLITVGPGAISIDALIRTIYRQGG